jgi:hypothetical protein
MAPKHMTRSRASKRILLRAAALLIALMTFGRPVASLWAAAESSVDPNPLQQLEGEELEAHPRDVRGAIAEPRSSRAARPGPYVGPNRLPLSFVADLRPFALPPPKPHPFVPRRLIRLLN